MHCSRVVFVITFGCLLPVPGAQHPPRLFENLICSKKLEIKLSADVVWGEAVGPQALDSSVVDVVVVGDSSVRSVVFGIGVESCDSAVGGDEG